MYEVEVKFRLEDVGRLRADLAELGAEEHAPLKQRDVYFNHPVRDFGETDEAFRVRISGNENVVTYKGPRVGDRTKTRREIEIPFAAGRSADCEEMLRTLGFRETLAVRKRRTPFHLEWEGRSVECVHDAVDGLGDFAEIEALADDNDRVEVQESVLRLAERLGLAGQEMRSYLVMLMQGNA